MRLEQCSILFKGSYTITRSSKLRILGGPMQTLTHVVLEARYACCSNLSICSPCVDVLVGSSKLIRRKRSLRYYRQKHSNAHRCIYRYQWCPLAPRVTWPRWIPVKVHEHHSYSTWRRSLMILAPVILRCFYISIEGEGE